MIGVLEAWFIECITVLLIIASENSVVLSEEVKAANATFQISSIEWGVEGSGHDADDNAFAIRMSEPFQGYAVQHNDHVNRNKSDGSLTVSDLHTGDEEHLPAGRMISYASKNADPNRLPVENIGAKPLIEVRNLTKQRDNFQQAVSQRGKPDSDYYEYQDYDDQVDTLRPKEPSRYRYKLDRVQYERYGHYPPVYPWNRFPFYQASYGKSRPEQRYPTPPYSSAPFPGRNPYDFYNPFLLYYGPWGVPGLRNYDVPPVPPVYRGDWNNSSHDPSLNAQLRYNAHEAPPVDIALPPGVTTPSETTYSSTVPPSAAQPTGTDSDYKQPESTTPSNYYQDTPTVSQSYNNELTTDQLPAIDPYVHTPSCQTTSERHSADPYQQSDSHENNYAPYHHSHSNGEDSDPHYDHHGESHDPYAGQEYSHHYEDPYANGEPHHENPYANSEPHHENPYANSEPHHEDPYANGETHHEDPYANGESLHEDPYANSEPHHEDPYANGESLHEDPYANSEPHHEEGSHGSHNQGNRNRRPTNRPNNRPRPVYMMQRPPYQSQRPPMHRPYYRPQQYGYRPAWMDYGYGILNDIKYGGIAGIAILVSAVLLVGFLILASASLTSGRSYRSTLQPSKFKENTHSNKKDYQHYWDRQSHKRPEEGANDYPNFNFPICHVIETACYVTSYVRKPKDSFPYLNVSNRWPYDDIRLMSDVSALLLQAFAGFECPQLQTVC